MLNLIFDTGLVIAVVALTLIIVAERKRFERIIRRHDKLHTEHGSRLYNLGSDMRNADKFIAELMDKAKAVEEHGAITTAALYHHLKEVLQTGPFSAVHHDDANHKIEIVPRKEAE